MGFAGGGGSQIALGVTLVIVAAFAVALGRAALSARRRAEARRGAMVALGFSPVASPPVALLESVAELQPPRSGEQVVLKDIYRRSISGGEAYLLDIVDGDGDPASWLGADTLALISPRLNLPYLALIPRPRLEGRAGDLAGSVVDRALTWAVTRGGLLRIDFEDDLDFHHRYIVVGRDEEQVRGFLTDRRRGHLVDAPIDLVVSGCKDGLALSASPMDAPQRSSLQARWEHAEQVLFWFRSVETI